MTTFRRSQQQREPGRKYCKIQEFKHIVENDLDVKVKQFIFKNKIVIQLDIYMYIDVRKFLPK